MLNIEIDAENAIAIFSPDAKLSESDFKSASKAIDPYIEEHGHLKGLIISTRTFPGWESMAGMLSHLSFVRDHHKKIEYVAFVTDSPLGRMAEKLADHFVSAQVRAFQYSELAQARAWITHGS